MKYFKGLDTLRFFAATAIIIHHIELLKGDLGISSLWRSQIFTNLGPSSVTFFFVLSGFLITYSLLQEKHETGTIALCNFYLKRAARILPLYYFIVLLGFFVLPNIHFFEQPIFSQRLYENFELKGIFFLFSLPQIPYIAYPAEPVPYLVQLWAVGVESVFYLIWPLIIIKSSKLSKFLIWFTLFFAVSPIVLKVFVVTNFISKIDGAFFLRSFDTMRLDCMAIGGLFACLLYFKNRNNSSALKVLYSVPIQILTVIALGGVFIFHDYASLLFNHEVYSLLFSIIIINISSNPKSHFQFISNISIFDYLGKRSYGIYVYHMVCIQLGLKIVEVFYKSSVFNWTSNVMLYSISILLAYLIAVLSFTLFENPARFRT